MACHVVCHQILPKPVLIHCQLDPSEQTIDEIKNKCLLLFVIHQQFSGNPAAFQPLGCGRFRQLYVRRPWDLQWRLHIRDPAGQFVWERHSAGHHCLSQEDIHIVSTETGCVRPFFCGLIAVYCLLITWLSTLTSSFRIIDCTGTWCNHVTCGLTWLPVKSRCR